MCRRTCNNRPNSCGCSGQIRSSIVNPYNVFPENYMYGYAYTPNQMLNKTFTPHCALKNGTIFPELVSPYEPDDSIRFIEYLKQGGCRNGM